MIISIPSDSPAGRKVLVLAIEQRVALEARCTAKFCGSSCFSAAAWPLAGAGTTEPLGGLVLRHADTPTVIENKNNAEGDET
jgi:hypothetical protein